MVIGLKLGVPIGELDAIEAMSSYVDFKFIKVITYWLQHGENVTWKDLAEAMGADTVGREDLKRKLFMKYC